MYSITQTDSFSTFSPDEWDNLLAETDETTAFQTWHYLNSWWSSFKTYQKRLRIYFIIEESQLLAIAPMYLDYENDSLYFIGHQHSDYNHFIVHPKHPQIHEALINHIMSTTRGINIVLENIPQHFTLYQVLKKQSPHLIHTLNIPCPRFNFEVKDEILACTNKKDMQKNYQRLSELGTINFVYERCEQTIKPLLSVLFNLHMERCETATFTSLFLRKENRDFYEALLTPPPHGKNPIFLAMLKLDEEIIACLLGFESKQDILCYKSAFQVEYRQYSPGNLLRRALIQHAHEAGFSAIDYTRGNEAYKQRISNATHYNATFTKFASPWVHWKKYTKELVKSCIYSNDK